MMLMILVRVVNLGMLAPLMLAMRVCAVDLGKPVRLMMMMMLVCGVDSGEARASDTDDVGLRHGRWRSLPG